MYIQNTGRNGRDMPFYVPDNYSGNAFSPAARGTARENPREKEPDENDAMDTREIASKGNGACPPPPPPSIGAEGMPPPPMPEREECAPPPPDKGAFAPPPPFHGLVERFPFLAPLLPPPRKGKKESGFSDLALIAALIFLLSEENDDGDNC